MSFSRIVHSTIHGSLVFFCKQRFLVFSFIGDISFLISFRLYCESTIYQCFISRYVYIHRLDMQLHFCREAFIVRLGALLYMIGLFLFISLRNGQLSNPLIYRRINIESSRAGALHKRFWFGAVFYQKKRLDGPETEREIEESRDDWKAGSKMVWNGGDGFVGQAKGRKWK